MLWDRLLLAGLLLLGTSHGIDLVSTGPEEEVGKNAARPRTGDGSPQARSAPAPETFFHTPEAEESSELRDGNSGVFTGR